MILSLHRPTKVLPAINICVHVRNSVYYGVHSAICRGTMWRRMHMRQRNSNDVGEWEWKREQEPQNSTKTSDEIELWFIELMLHAHSIVQRPQQQQQQQQTTTKLIVCSQWNWNQVITMNERQLIDATRIWTNNYLKYNCSWRVYRMSRCRWARTKCTIIIYNE